MADDGEPLLLERPLRAGRLWFIAPGEPKDFKTLETLANTALQEARDTLLTDRHAAQLLAAIGRTGREGYTLALQRRVCDVVSHALVTTKTRQPVKHASIDYSCVPLPKKRQTFGTLIIRAWSHTLRSTFDLDLGH